MLSKPRHGWTEFSLGESRYSISYLSNVPLDWLDRAIFGLETLSPFTVSGYCEPGRVICTVEIPRCRITFEDGGHCRGEGSLETVAVTMLDFCKMLHRDFSSCVDAWSQWNASYNFKKEDIQSRLDRLQTLIGIRENCF